MSDDLISRSAAIEAVKRREKILGEYALVSTSSFKNFLRNRPAVAAEPVRHGRWIHDINNLFGCSECMERTTMSFRTGLKNYCPNCGAKMMDAEVEG